jgi:glycine cleavage system aminomethyltransferase T
MPEATGVDAAVHASAGLTAVRHGRPVVLNYGSAPGELSACLTRVGLVERSDIVAFRARGVPASIDEVTTTLTGVRLAVGGSVRLADAWWCRPGAATTLVIGPADSAPRLLSLLRMHARHHPELSVDGDADRFSLFGVVGPKAPSLLAALDVYGPAADPRGAAPCTSTTLGGVAAVWLLESDGSALVCVTRADAHVAISAIAVAGQPLGLCNVGQEAFANYALVQRQRVGASLRAGA